MYRTIYQAAFWTMRKTDYSLPTDLAELVKLLAVNKAQQQEMQEQQQQQQHIQQPSTQQVHPVQQQQSGSRPMPGVGSDQFQTESCSCSGGSKAGGDVSLS